MGAKISKEGSSRRTSHGNHNSLAEVTKALALALALAGLKSCNIIVGVDFTKSNEGTGARSFQGKNLHHIGKELNPYEQAMYIIGKTFPLSDKHHRVPCFGLGDALTCDQDVFTFFLDDKRFCQGFKEVLSRYREIVPLVQLAGPTSFAPIIEMAMTIVHQSGGQYHVLLMIANGQVSRSVDTGPGQLSPQEQKTVDAIQASFVNCIGWGWRWALGHDEGVCREHSFSSI